MPDCPINAMPNRVIAETARILAGFALTWTGPFCWQHFVQRAFSMRFEYALLTFITVLARRRAPCPTFQCI